MALHVSVFGLKTNSVRVLAEVVEMEMKESRKRLTHDKLFEVHKNIFRRNSSNKLLSRNFYRVNDPWPIHAPHKRQDEPPTNAYKVHT